MTRFLLVTCLLFASSCSPAGSSDPNRFTGGCTAVIVTWEISDASSRPSYHLQKKLTARFGEIALGDRPPGGAVMRRDDAIVIDVVGAGEQVAVDFVEEYLLDPVDFEGQSIALRILGTQQCINKYPGYSVE